MQEGVGDVSLSVAPAVSEMPIDRVTIALGPHGIKRSGAERWESRCPVPAHEDHSPSLSISIGGGGRVLVKCHRGCEFKDIAAALDLTEADFFSDEKRAPAKDLPFDQWPVIATYIYENRAGDPHFRVQRKRSPISGRKTFRQHGADGRGGWLPNMNGVDLVLYHLPQLGQADPKDPVFVVEGEACVESVEKIGLVATTNAGGAGKWLAKYGDDLRGRDVVILPDNDEPGSKHGATVAKALDGTAASVRILQLPGLAAKGDVADWIGAGGTAEQLLMLAKTSTNPPAGTGGDSSFTSFSSSSPTRTQDPSWPGRLDPAAYHGLAGRIVQRIDPHTEADPIAILVQTMAAFGNAIGRGPYFPVEASRHYPNLFLSLVGQTSKSRKGTSWAHVQRIVGLADEVWASNRIISGLSSGEGLIAEVRDPVVGKGGVVDEGVSDKRLLVQEQELARVLKVATRDGNSLSATIREAWDSVPLRVITKNSPLRATNTLISIVAHVTKDELLRHMGETEAANGFANRFLWVCVRRSKLLPEGGGTIEVGDLARELTEALAFARQLGDRQIKRDDRARAIWISAYPELSKDRPGMAGAILGRIEAQVMRLALVYALLDRSEVIGEPHLKAALALAEYCERSVHFIFGTSLGDRLADDIIEALKQSPEGLTRKALSEHFGRNVAAPRLGAALDLLRRNGLATSTKEDTGGRPAERWRYELNELNELSPPDKEVGCG